MPPKQRVNNPDPSAPAKRCQRNRAASIADPLTAILRDVLERTDDKAVGDWCGALLKSGDGANGST